MRGGTRAAGGSTGRAAGMFLSVWIALTAAADAAPRSALLRWQPSAASGVAGYHVYMRPMSGSFSSSLDARLPPAATDGTLSYTVGGLDTATSYSFAVTAYLATGLESAMSNELMLAATTTTTTTTTVTTSTSTTTTVTTSTTTTAPRVTTTTAPATTSTTTSTTTTPATTSTTTSTIPTSPCGAATVVPAQGGTFKGTTSGTSLQSASCVATGNAPESVFQWTPAVSGTAVISTCNATATTFDTVLYLRNATCSGAQLACNDDTTGCGTTTDVSNPHRGSRVQPTVTAGQTYYIVVDGYAGAKGSFALTITPPGTTTPPLSTPCAGATVIPAQGGTFTGTTSGPSAQGAACITTGNAPERVFQWTPGVSGTATISTCSATATTYDTVLYLRNATCAATQLACNDDTTGCGTTTDVSNPHRGSSIQPTVTAGQTYYIVVDGYAGASGSFALTVAPPGPAAPPAVSSPVLGTVDGATEETCVAPAPCQQATWDAATGCVLTAGADGTPCEVGDPCLVGSCLDAKCTGTEGLAAGRSLDVERFVLRSAAQLRLLARGTFTTGSTIDPTTTGVGVELRTAGGEIVYRATLDGAALKANRSRTAFRYATKPRDKGRAGAEGLRRIILTVRGGKVRAVVTANVPDTIRQVGKAQLTWVLRLGSECARGLDLTCSEGPVQSVCRGTEP